MSIRCILTGRKAVDYGAADDQMSLPAPMATVLLADTGYDSDRIRENLLMDGISPIIASRFHRKPPIPRRRDAYTHSVLSLANLQSGLVDAERAIMRNGPLAAHGSADAMYTDQ